MFLFLIILLIVFGVLAFFSQHQMNYILALLLLFIVGISLIGPYAITAVLSLDMGGKKAASTISGFNDAVGYIFSIASGYCTGWLVTNFGWYSVFILLEIVTIITTVFCMVYFLFFELWKKKKTPKPVVLELNSDDDGEKSSEDLHEDSFD